MLITPAPESLRHLSAIDEQQHTRDHAKQRQQDVAIGDPETEQGQEIAQDNPHTKQEHALRAVHVQSISPPGGRARPLWRYKSTTVARSRALYCTNIYLVRVDADVRPARPSVRLRQGEGRGLDRARAVGCPRHQG